MATTLTAHPWLPRGGAALPAALAALNDPTGAVNTALGIALRTYLRAFEVVPHEGPLPEPGLALWPSGDWSDEPPSGYWLVNVRVRFGRPNTSTTRAAFYAAIVAWSRALRNAGVLWWIAEDNAPERYFDVVRTRIGSVWNGPPTFKDLNTNPDGVPITFVCRPFARGAYLESFPTVANSIAAADPPNKRRHFSGFTVDGDAPTVADLTVISGSAGLRHVYVRRVSNFGRPFGQRGQLEQALIDWENDTNNQRVLLDTEAISTGAGVTAAVADAEAQGGSASDFVFGTNNVIDTVRHAWRPTFGEMFRGGLEVWARVRPTAAVLARMRVDMLAGSVTIPGLEVSRDWQAAVTFGSFVMVPLGRLMLPVDEIAGANVDLQLKAVRDAGAGNLRFDMLEIVPVGEPWAAWWSDANVNTNHALKLSSSARAMHQSALNGAAILDAKAGGSVPMVLVPGRNSFYVQLNEDALTGYVDRKNPLGRIDTLRVGYYPRFRSV